MRDKLKAKVLEAWHDVKEFCMRCMVALMVFAAVAEGGKLCKYTSECFEMIVSGDNSSGYFRLFELYCYFMLAYGIGGVLIKHFKTSKEDSDE